MIKPSAARPASCGTTHRAPYKLLRNTDLGRVNTGIAMVDGAVGAACKTGIGIGVVISIGQVEIAIQAFPTVLVIRDPVLGGAIICVIDEREWSRCRKPPFCNLRD